MMLHNSVTNAMPVILVNSVLEQVSPPLEGGGSGDNFYQLPGDDRLSGPVEGQGQFVDHFSCKQKIKGFLTNELTLILWSFTKKKRNNQHIYINHSSKATEHKFFVDFVVERIFM